MSKPQTKEANSLLLTLLSGGWHLILNVPPCQFDNNSVLGKLCVFYNKDIEIVFQTLLSSMSGSQKKELHKSFIRRGAIRRVI